MKIWGGVPSFHGNQTKYQISCLLVLQLHEFNKKKKQKQKKKNMSIGTMVFELCEFNEKKKKRKKKQNMDKMGNLFVAIISAFGDF